MWSDVAAVAMTAIAAHWLSNVVDGWSFLARLQSAPRLRSTQSGHKVLHLRVTADQLGNPSDRSPHPLITIDVSLFLVHRIDELSCCLREGALLVITGALVGVRESDEEVGRRIVDVVASNVKIVPALPEPNATAQEVLSESLT